MYILRNKAKKLKNVQFLHLLSIFDSFALKIKTNLARMVVEPKC